MKDNTPKIPKYAHAFFKWYCKGNRYEEMHGDLEEFYYERVELYGQNKARWQYWMDVLRCCQPYAWKRPAGQLPTMVYMFGNYSKISLRRMGKSPLNAFINIFGLSMAIGICVMLYGFNHWVDSIDDFHEHKESVHLVTSFIDRDGKLQQNGRSPRPLAQAMSAELPQVIRSCRVEPARVIVKQGANVFHETLQYTDPDFLDMFTFPLIRGNKEQLQDLNAVIISEEMSIKYFGDANPFGKDLEIIFNESFKRTFTVGGVARAFPDATDIDFDFLINFKNLTSVDRMYREDDWASFVSASFVQIAKNSDLDVIRRGMDQYLEIQNAVQDDVPIAAWQLEPLSTLYERSGDIKDSITSPYYESNHMARMILTILGSFLLALACINYINIAIVSASKRLKEIGLRKVIGANRSVIIGQFLAENIIVTFFALLVGTLLGITVFIPWFQHINDFKMGMEVLDYRLWIYLLFIMLFTGVASGIYPALYISRFQANNIFKGTLKFGGQNWLTKAFLGVQLVLSCLLITTAVMFTQNSTFMENRSWGYVPNEALYIEVPNQEAFEQVKNSLLMEAEVVSIAGSEHHLGRAHGTFLLQDPDRSYEVQQMAVDAAYFETMKLEVVNGRAFKPDFETDRRSLVVNEELVRRLALQDPIGKSFKVDDDSYTIVGVVKDFHPYSFDQEIQPTVFTTVDEADIRYLSTRVLPGSESDAREALESIWSELYPDLPFQGGHQEDVWGGYFGKLKMHGSFWRSIAMIVILMAGLGLFGLVSLNVSSRLKEFSIRKVLGATLSHLSSIIVKKYTLLYTIALFLGAGLSYYLVAMFFDMIYPYHIPMTISSVMVAVGILVLVLALVVSAQMTKLSRQSPVDGLHVD